MVCLANAHEFINVYASDLGSFGQRDTALLIQPQCIGNMKWGQILIFQNVGAPPPGRWVVVCEAYRDEGVAPTENLIGI